ncbi:nuclear transport factor 2 family protein [uncultured Novosphingobium sp.]|uniref:nuclear transport factor 2 family protein n=1 Tax=uncultured Novosphingobium sp. TaxID=292277 RepID=UPI003747EAE3
MTEALARLDALEKRLGAVEDELAVIRLVASYGPLVDSGSPDLAPDLFAEDGVYDVSYGRMTGPAAFSELLKHSEHLDAIKGGIAHVMGLPWVRIDGDHAIAVNCTQLYLRRDDGYAIFRVAQNVWKLERRPQGWKIIERTNRLIGDGDDARAMLEAAI